MATASRRLRFRSRPGTILRDVDWATYVQLRDSGRNDRLRMTYLDGTLVLMSPQLIHDNSDRRLMLVVEMVTMAFRIPILGTATTTLRRKGETPRRGSGKEPDYGYYFGANDLRMRSKDDINLEVDPPPDLAIEIDNKADSSKALPTYARLGVPEVWRYKPRKKTLWFGRLVGDQYQEIDRSLNLPMLTPSLVLAALAEADRLGETDWKFWLLDWARTLPIPGGPA